MRSRGRMRLLRRRRRNPDESIEELRQIADGRDDVLGEAAECGQRCELRIEQTSSVSTTNASPAKAMLLMAHSPAD